MPAGMTGMLVVVVVVGMADTPVVEVPSVVAVESRSHCMTSFPRIFLACSQPSD